MMPGLQGSGHTSYLRDPSYTWYDFCIFPVSHSTDLLITKLSVLFSVCVRSRSRYFFQAQLKITGNGNMILAGLVFAGAVLATAESPRSHITCATLSEEKGQGPIVLDVTEQATDQLGG